MNEDFIFRLGADVSSFTKSITEVEAELKSARAAVKGALGDDLIQANKYVEDLEQSLKNLKSVGVDIPSGKGLKELPAAAQKAQNTLTGLSGVVRDLPFGFIAIQNNLPILIDQFSALSKESGGVGGAVKNLAGSLVGPAGAAFAFGAVISVVTGLIQKYGSLGNAIKVLVADNKALVEAQLEFTKESNKAAAAVVIEDAKVRTLSKAILDSKTPRKDQIAYYEELKRIAPEVVSGIDDENIGTAESNRLISQNVLLRAELVRLKIQEGGINAAASKNAEALAVARNKEAEAQKNLTTAQAEYNIVSKASGQNPRAAQGVATQAAAAASALNAAKKEIADLTVVQDQFLGQLEPITLRVAEINNQFKIQTDNLKKANKETSNGEKESAKRAKALENETKQLEKKKIAEDDAFEASRNASNQRIAAAKAEQLQQQAAKNTTEALKQQKIAADQAAIALQNLQLAQMNEDALSIADPLAKLKELTPQLLKEANLTAATTLFKDTFFNPIQDLFSDLLSGSKEAMQQFSKTIANTIKQLVAKVIATGIIQLLITLASGGFGAAAGGFAGGIKTVLKGIGKSLGFGGVANPNFGGITSGGMQMSGAVNVVLRGQDLVGALNRTNAQINRVG